jgi:hypothetical protein
MYSAVIYCSFHTVSFYTMGSLREGAEQWCLANSDLYPEWLGCTWLSKDTVLSGHSELSQVALS